MARFRWFKNTAEWGGNFSNFWGLLPAAWQTFVTAGFTAVTAWSGIAHLGLARGIFLSSGVLAFGMGTVFLSLRITQILGMFQRLTVASYGISNIGLNKNYTEIDIINLNATLRNDSQRPMFYRLKRVHATLAQKTSNSNVVSTNVIIIPAFGGIQVISFSSIFKIPLSTKKNADGFTLGPEGEIEFEVQYGPSAEELDFCLRQVTAIQIGIVSFPAQPKQRHAQLSTQIKVLEHTRK